MQRLRLSPTELLSELALLELAIAQPRRLQLGRSDSERQLASITKRLRQLSRQISATNPNTLTPRLNQKVRDCTAALVALTLVS
jgi:hypothetical protein